MNARDIEVRSRIPPACSAPSSRTRPASGARKTSRARIAVILASLLAPLLFASGCVGVGGATGIAVDTAMKAITYPVYEWAAFGAYKYDNDADAPWKSLEDDAGRDYGDELVGIAVSGGGSRAAYFLASALDELRKIPAPGKAPHRTLLDEVDYISSVSGGSLSSAYYVYKRPPTSDPAALDTFFAEYREAMQMNFEARSLGRMFVFFRWLPMLLTYYDRARLMAGVWDADFFDDATFADLPPPREPFPSLIVNGASYSTGNKFIFSRVPAARVNGSATFGKLGDHLLIKGGAAPEHRPLRCDGFDTIDSDIGSYKLSLAVAASASVPGLIGPIYLKNRAVEDAYEMVGDGGIYDNYGAETLYQLFATILEERPGLKARIIIVDGSGYFSARLDRDRFQAPDFVDRMSSIAWLRGSASTEILYQLIPRIEVVKAPPGRPHDGVPMVGDRARSPFRNLTTQVVSMYKNLTPEELADEAKGTSRLQDWLQGKPITDSLGKFNQQVRLIGTRFSIAEDDAALLSVKARNAVREVLGAAPKSPAAPAPAPPPATAPR